MDLQKIVFYFLIILLSILTLVTIGFGLSQGDLLISIIGVLIGILVGLAFSVRKSIY